MLAEESRNVLGAAEERARRAKREAKRNGSQIGGGARGGGQLGGSLRNAAIRATTHLNGPKWRVGRKTRRGDMASEREREREDKGRKEGADGGSWLGWSSFSPGLARRRRIGASPFRSAQATQASLRYRPTTTRPCKRPIRPTEKLALLLGPRRVALSAHRPSQIALNRLLRRAAWVGRRTSRSRRSSASRRRWWVSSVFL